jgi:hypothetical protein
VSIPQLLFIIFFAWVFLVIILWMTTWKKGEIKYKAPYHVQYIFPETNPVVSETIILQDKDITEVYLKSLEYFKSNEKYIVRKNQEIIIIIKKAVQNEVIEIRQIDQNNIVHGIEAGAFGYIRVSFFKDDTCSYVKLLAASDTPLKKDVQLCLWRQIIHGYLKHMNCEMTNDGYSRIYSKKDENEIIEYNKARSFFWIFYRYFKGNTTST